MAEPLASVIIATRNRASLVGRAIGSVVSQSFPDWELVVVDDASTDTTSEELRKLRERDARMRYVRNEVQIGIAKSHNRAIGEARGKYIAVLDDDDWWAVTDKLVLQVKFLEENPAYVLVGGGVVVVDEKGQERYRYLKPEHDAQIRNVALFANPMAHSTVLYRKEAALRVGLYDASYNGHAADRALFLRLGRMGKLYNFQDYLAYYTLGVQNMFLSHQRMQLKASLMHMKKYREGYPYFLPALCLNCAVYLYTFLPQQMREPLNASLVYLKRIMFDRVRPRNIREA
ncbi:MAG: hypothetical protein A3J67_00255 [Parcubacteria group bacterium RIFCSPHIGHO2_02_FULL_48_10b]|nr:MAG: hypothetical protein A3J67_00255 [Parcubacteria group bacterium RIFCSPHIGHO2_02_FULL_48_10b]